MGVGELSPLLPAASLGIALFVFLCFLPLFSGLLLHAGKMLRLMSDFCTKRNFRSCCWFEKEFSHQLSIIVSSLASYGTKYMNG